MKKIMSFILLLSIILGGCSPKIVTKIVFKNIDFNNIEIESSTVPDSIIINNINITGSDYYYLKKEKTLFVNNYFMDSIIISNANGDSLIYDPFINTLIVDKVHLKNKKYEFKIDSILISTYTIQSIFINKNIVAYDRNPTIIKKVKSLYEKVKEKQDSTINVIINQIKEDPNHAVRQIQNSEFYKDIQRRMDNILKYIQSDNYTVAISEERITELYNIDRLLDLIVQETYSKKSIPKEFSNELFFELGEYKIKKNNIEEADKLIKEIANRINDGGILYVNVATSGYSDDIGFLIDLENELKFLYPNTSFPSDAIEKRKLLNILLSEQRAESLANYIKKGIENLDILVNINYDSKGFGEDYPPSLKNSGIICNGDCKERRIAFIANFVIKQK